MRTRTFEDMLDRVYEENPWSDEVHTWTRYPFRTKHEGDVLRRFFDSFSRKFVEEWIEENIEMDIVEMFAESHREQFTEFRRQEMMNKL